MIKIVGPYRTEKSVFSLYTNGHFAYTHSNNSNKLDHKACVSFIWISPTAHSESGNNDALSNTVYYNSVKCPLKTICLVNPKQGCPSKYIYICIYYILILIYYVLLYIYIYLLYILYLFISNAYIYIFQNIDKVYWTIWPSMGFYKISYLTR